MLLGLVILATLLASIAIARGRFLRQIADADRRARQVRVADDLLGRWLAGSADAVPRDGRGDEQSFAWRTRPVRAAAVAALGASVVRLEVFDRATAAAPVAVEFLVHDAPATRPAEAR